MMPIFKMCEHTLCNSVATKEVMENSDRGVFYGVLCDLHAEIAVRQGCVETDAGGLFLKEKQIMFDSYLDAYAHVERCCKRDGSHFIDPETLRAPNGGVLQ